MNTNDVIGWVLSAAGVLLLLAFGKASLALVLVPVAAVLACGLVWVGPRSNRATYGLE